MFSTTIKIHISRFVFALITLVIIGSYSKQVEQEASETNREDWIDPGDMINFDPAESVKPKVQRYGKHRSVLNRLTSQVKNAE